MALVTSAEKKLLAGHLQVRDEPKTFILTLVLSRKQGHPSGYHEGIWKDHLHQDFIFLLNAVPSKKVERADCHL